MEDCLCGHFQPGNGLCEVYVLSETSVQIHGIHFAKPLERNDIFNAPAHLLVPTLRFSIQQIYLVWYIYGGSDFALLKSSKVFLQGILFSMYEIFWMTVVSNRCR